MPTKPIHLIVPEPDREVTEPVETLFISPEGADPDREVPGFFIIQIAGKPIMQPDSQLPRQFLSLDAVYAFLREQFGWKNPLPVTSYLPVTPGGPCDFPAVWGAERKLGRKRVIVRVRYLGSFAYWSGRPVDPTVVGTQRENLN